MPIISNNIEKYIVECNFSFKVLNLYDKKSSNQTDAFDGTFWAPISSATVLE